jgi:hypothetical protein
LGDSTTLVEWTIIYSYTSSCVGLKKPSVLILTHKNLYSIEPSTPLLNLQLEDSNTCVFGEPNEFFFITYEEEEVARKLWEHKGSSRTQRVFLSQLVTKVVKTSLLNSVPTKRESLVAGPPRAQRKAQGKKTKKTKKKEKKM